MQPVSLDPIFSWLHKTIMKIFQFENYMLHYLSAAFEYQEESFLVTVHIEALLKRLPPPVPGAAPRVGTCGLGESDIFLYHMIFLINVCSNTS